MTISDHWGGAAPHATDPNRLGAMIRQRRTALGLTLRSLSSMVGCAPSYISALETGLRAAPSEDLLGRLERALAIPEGELVGEGAWLAAGPSVRREVAALQERLHAKGAAVARLSQIVGGAGLDDAFRSGELRRLVESISPEAAPTGGAEGRGTRGPGTMRVAIALPRAAPLINRVAAGYPTEFTDLGYPARVADEYVRCPEVDDPDAFAARVVGDSMLPDYREGDIVVFSPAREVKSGMDCFVRLERDDEATFKRVYFEDGGEGEALIRLQPLNNAYRAKVVGREEVAGLYAAASVTRGV